MKKCISRRILFYFIMLFLTVVFVHGGNKTVFAATSGKNQCKVTFANSEGKGVYREIPSLGSNCKEGDSDQASESYQNGI